MPAPVVIPPSQDWNGNDGPWSSFTLQVGTPAQDVKVFVSTAGFQTWVVLPQGCTASDPADCSTLRGGEFLTNQSTTWALRNGSVNGFFELGIEKNLGYTGNGEFGYDTVALGWQSSGGPSLQQQIVAGIATKGFYLGLFGLNPRPTNFSNFDDPFEESFGIHWNDTVQAYLVDDALHASLLAKNANVTFALSNSSIGHTVDITLPYAAFDLTAEYPLMPTASRYFPLMRAANDTQYTLGRTFLQEAYLIADYERRNFSVSQCAWNADPQQHIMTITSASDQGPPPTQSIPRPHTLAKGATAGAVIGGVVVLTAFILLFYFYCLKPYHQRYRSRGPEELHEKGSNIVDPREHELDAQESLDRVHEFDAQDQTRNELDALDQSRFELDPANSVIPELDVCVAMPPRHELEAEVSVYELPTSEMSLSCTKPALAATMEQDTELELGPWVHQMDEQILNVASTDL